MGRGETEEQEAGVEGEGGAEDEGGEGDAVGHQDEGEEPPSAWTHSPKLISFDLMYIDLPKIYQVRSDANWFLFGKFLTL